MKKLFMILTIISIALAAVSVDAAEQKIVGKNVTYSVGGTTMKGYLAYDSAILDKRPGILVVHEWWGLNDYIRHRARMLAELGYVAFAVDMYGNGKVATHPQDAQTFSSKLANNFDTMKLRFLAAEQLLKKQKMVDRKKIAAIGYCFGGGVVLNMALQGVDLKGVASFHGSLGAVGDVKPGSVKAKIIIFNGDADKFNALEQIKAIKEKMGKAGVNYKFMSYPGAMHSFTNPDADKYAKEFNLPIAYNAEADKKSWEEMKMFLDAIFR
ncbi:MAG: dienelactone hydrolase family protein [Smithella sp.]